MIDPYLVSTAILAAGAVGFARLAIGRRAALRQAENDVRALRTDAKVLNRLLDHRAGTIADHEETISRLTEERVLLQASVNCFQDEAAARQAQRVAASKKAAQVRHERALERAATK
jgi:hypothetical protein